MSNPGEIVRKSIEAYHQGRRNIPNADIDALLGIDTSERYWEDEDRLNELFQQCGPEQFFNKSTPYPLIREFLRELQLSSEDVAYDLGSGHGRVPIYGGLVTSARYCGIEIVPERVVRCQGIVENLQLERVSFQQGNVQDADLSDGTVFFMFDPFTVDTLNVVCDRLRALACEKDLTVVSYGSTNSFFLGEEWLRSRKGTPSKDELGIFNSCRE